MSQTTIRFTVEEYDRMIESGVFEQRDDVRVELLFGEIVEMNPPNPPHDYTIDLLNYWSIDVTSRDEIWVRVQNSLGIPEFDSVPGTRSGLDESPRLSQGPTAAGRRTAADRKSPKQVSTRTDWSRDRFTHNHRFRTTGS